jgi:Helix-turn-helix domain
MTFDGAVAPSAMRVSLPRPFDALQSRRIGYSDAARLLAIPVGTLRSMVCRRQIPHIRLSARIVIFDVDALERWLDCRCVPAANDNGPGDDARRLDRRFAPS